MFAPGHARFGCRLDKAALECREQWSAGCIARGKVGVFQPQVIVGDPHRKSFAGAAFLERGGIGHVGIHAAQWQRTGDGVGLRQSLQIVIVWRGDGVAAGVEEPQRAGTKDAELQRRCGVATQPQQAGTVLLRPRPAPRAVTRNIAAGIYAEIDPAQAIGPVRKQRDRELLSGTVGAGDGALIGHGDAADR